MLRDPLGVCQCGGRWYKGGNDGHGERDGAME